MLTPIQLQELVVTDLVRKAGGTKRRWRIALGAVQVYPAETHPHCNWSVKPSGTTREIAAIERLLDTVRLTHPLVAQG